jgi:GH15 family glucan-1,4-alpha-glucosidase
VALPIEDYGLIGDTQTVALVGRDGSIDWLCLPRFDAPACFAALLGNASHGRWSIAPVEGARAARRGYRGDSLVLEQEFDTPTGTVRLIDFMPVRHREPDLVRIVEGVSGAVDIHLDLAVRFDYGSIVPWATSHDGAWRAIGGPDALSLWTPLRLHGKGLTTVADFTIRAGDQVPFVLAWHPSHEPPPRPLDPLHAVDDTVRWWQAWAGRCTYEGPWRDAVVRSLVTLKALTFAPTGGIVAAATTSLPEHVGGVRNWDYRHCWLRDATFTLYALIGGGFTGEAAAWRDWLQRAIAGEASALQIMYGCGGERRLTELELSWLPGYENSRPVRVGNSAVNQRQLDVFGEVMDSLHLARRSGLDPKPGVWSLQRELLRYLEEIWREPDHGIWEVRGPRRQFTHSKVMAWVAFDRAVQSVEQWRLDGPVDRWRRVRDEIHAEVCACGYHAARGTFTQFYGSDRLDASLLMIPLVGFLPPGDPRVQRTVDAIARELTRDGFVQRYLMDAGSECVDGLPAGEGVFLACTCWLADNYALQGRFDEARELFERLLGVRNDLGLLSEQYDPEAHRHIGNFPQAFSHVGIINTARNLARRHGPAEDRGDGRANGEERQDAGRARSRRTRP